jgi:hypothetical protein
MSIVAAELIAYGVLVPPTPDATGDATSNIGGGIDVTNRVVFSSVLGSPQICKIRSSAADTRFTRITGRKSDGTLVTENLQLNGVTPVPTANTYDRILKFAVYDSSNTTLTGSATLTASLYQNDNSTLIGQVGGSASTSTETGFYGMFIGSSSDPVATKTRYEKFFYKNTNASLALQAPTIQLTADASAVLAIAVENSNGGTSTTTNRLTAPGAAMTAFGTTAITVPAGSIASGAAVAVWVRQSLAIGNAPINASFQTTIQGQST